MTVLEPGKPLDQELTLAIQMNEDQRGLVTITDEISGTCIALGTLAQIDESPDLVAFSEYCTAVAGYGIPDFGISGGDLLAILQLAGEAQNARERLMHLTAEGLASTLSCVPAGSWQRRTNQHYVTVAGTIPAHLVAVSL